MKDQVTELRVKSREWDNQPRTVLNFTNRVIKKYGLDSIRSKLSYANGEYYDSFDRLKEFNSGRYSLEPSKKDLISESLQKDEFLDAINNSIVDMEVPALEYERWAYSAPFANIEDFKKRKLILDRYLETFSKYERSKIIKIMCEGNYISNYVSFLDIDPNYMNIQQKLIYKDIIKFYDLEMQKEYVEREKVLERIQLGKEASAELAKMNAGIESDDDDNVRSEKLAAILAGENYEDLEDMPRIEIGERLEIEKDDESEASKKLEEQLLELRKSQEEQIANLQKQLMENKISSNIREVLKQQQAKLQEQQLSGQVNGVRTLNLGDPKIKTLLFSPTTTLIRHDSIFGANKDYEPSYNKEFAVKGYTLSDDQISRVGYNNNIAKLIEDRNAVALANQRLVQEIIRNQIIYNNQFGNGNFGVEKLMGNNSIYAQSSPAARQEQQGMMSILTANASANKQAQVANNAVPNQNLNIFSRKISVDDGSIINITSNDAQPQRNIRGNEMNSMAYNSHADEVTYIKPTLIKKSDIALNTIKGLNKITNNDTRPSTSPLISIPKKTFGQPSSINANVNNQSYQQVSINNSSINRSEQPRSEIFNKVRKPQNVNYINPTSMYKNPNLRENQVVNKQQEQVVVNKQVNVMQHQQNKNEQNVAKPVLIGVTRGSVAIANQQNIINSNAQQSNYSSTTNSVAVNNKPSNMSNQISNTSNQSSSVSTNKTSLNQPLNQNNNYNKVQSSKIIRERTQVEGQRIINGEKVVFSNIKESVININKGGSVDISPKYKSPDDVIAMYKLNVKEKNSKNDDQKEKTKILIGQYLPTKKID